MSDGFNNLKKAHENMRNRKGYVITQRDVLETINLVVDQQERIEKLESLVRCLLENNPDDSAADAVTVLDVWRKDAARLLEDEE